MSFAATWMDLNIITLSEVSHNLLWEKNLKKSGYMYMYN